MIRRLKHIICMEENRIMKFITNCKEKVCWGRRDKKEQQRG
jgi:hypothetical protein